MCQLLCTIFACIHLETSPYLKQLSPILRARRHACCWFRKWKVSTANCSSGFAVRRRAQQHLPDACRAHRRRVSHHRSRHQVTGGPRTRGHQNTRRPVSVGPGQPADGIGVHRRRIIFPGHRLQPARELLATCRSGRALRQYKRKCERRPGPGAAGLDPPRDMQVCTASAVGFQPGPQLQLQGGFPLAAWTARAPSTSAPSWSRIGGTCTSCTRSSSPIATSCRPTRP